MDQSYLLNMTNEALVLVLMLSMPPIIVATVVGVVVSLIQALTQIQEQTLGFGIKLLVVSAVLLLTASWVGSEMYKFTEQIFTILPSVRQ